MDGYFVPNISFGHDVLKSVRKYTDLPFEAHLMVKEPINFIEKFANSGSDIIIFHLESNSDVLESIKEITKFNKKVGISIKPNTNIEKIFKYLNLIDLVTIMTVEPGFGGQKFINSQSEKIKILKEKINFEGLKTLIEVDGGINEQTSKIVTQNGADILVAGTYILGSENIYKTISDLKKLKTCI
jgi:ribulose-phosphate 3-epimerase